MGPKLWYLVEKRICERARLFCHLKPKQSASNGFNISSSHPCSRIYGSCSKASGIRVHWQCLLVISSVTSVLVSERVRHLCDIDRSNHWGYCFYLKPSCYTSIISSGKWRWSNWGMGYVIERERVVLVSAWSSSAPINFRFTNSIFSWHPHVILSCIEEHRTSISTNEILTIPSINCKMFIKMSVGDIHNFPRTRKC